MSEQVIFDMYAKIELGNNAICECCQRAYPNLSRPVSIWQVGTKYENSKYKLLFVGKNARGNPGRKKGAFLDSTICAEDFSVIKDGRIGVTPGRYVKRFIMATPGSKLLLQIW